MHHDDLIEQCQQLAILRHEIKELKKLEKELTESIKSTTDGRGIIRDHDGRRICQVSPRRKKSMGIRLKFFKPWLRDFIMNNG